MGLSIAGLGFLPNVSTLEEQKLVQLIFGNSIEPSGTQKPHDIRVPGNVAVESRNGATFIYNGEIAEKILFDGQFLEPAVFTALGTPELVVIFCHYDSGDSFGYSIVKDGITVRSRVHTLNKTKDEGAPSAFEMPWLQAESFIEEEGEQSVYRNIKTGEITSESHITSRLLVEVMTAFFGIVPWEEWNYRSKFNYYCKQSSRKMVEQSATKARWRFW